MFERSKNSHVTQRRIQNPNKDKPKQVKAFCQDNKRLKDFMLLLWLNFTGRRKNLTTI